MEKYELFIIDKVPAICLQDDKYYVIDTGSPKSFSDSGRVDLNSMNYEVEKSLHGIDAAYLRVNLGNAHIAGLIGLDIIKQSVYHFNYRDKQLVIATNEYQPNEAMKIELPVFFPMNHYVAMQIQYQQQSYSALMDTGAKFSYANKRLLHTLEQAGVEQDFNPAMGKIQANRYINFQYDLGSQNLVHDIYENAQVTNAMDRLKCDVLLGYDCFATNPFSLDIPNSKLYIYR